MAKSTAILFFTDTLTEKFSEQFLCQQPVFLVDAILHFRDFNFTLYQPRVLQFFQMLGHSSFSYGQFLMDITEIAALLSGKKLNDGNTCRMPQSLGETRQFFLLGGVFFLFFSYFTIFVVRKSTNIFPAHKIFQTYFIKKPESCCFLNKFRLCNS